MPRTSPPFWLRMPLWVRWMLSLGVAVVVLVALVVFVEAHNNNDLASESPTAALRANREAEIVVSQDQAPHVVKLDAAIRPRAAFTDAVRAAMNRLLAHGAIQGPLNHVTCSAAGSGHGLAGYRCIGVADQLNYPFVGVIDRRTQRITYCKRDPPPVPSQNIPISARCQI